MGLGKLAQNLIVNRHRLINVGVQDLHRRADKGLPAGNTAVEDSAQRIEVGAVVDVTPAQTLFRRHKGRCADGAPGVGQLWHIEGAGNAKITEQRHQRVIQRFENNAGGRAAADGAQENIARFDIAMDDPPLVRIGERLGNRRQQQRTLLGRQAAAGGEERGEIFALYQLHGNIGGIVAGGHTDAQRAHNVRMVQFGCRLGLIAKAVVDLFVAAM